MKQELFDNKLQRAKASITESDSRIKRFNAELKISFFYQDEDPMSMEFKERDGITKRFYSNDNLDHLLDTCAGEIKGLMENPDLTRVSYILLVVDTEKDKEFIFYK